MSSSTSPLANQITPPHTSNSAEKSSIMKLIQSKIARQADNQVQTDEQVQFDLQGHFHEPDQSHKQFRPNEKDQSLAPPHPSCQLQYPLYAECNEQPQLSAQWQAQVYYYPLMFVHPQPQPLTFIFTNHDFLSCNDSLVSNELKSARVPVFSANLSPFFTPDQASNEGTIFGRSLAYLITDTVDALNAYLPILGVTNWEDLETEERFCEGIERLFECTAGLRNDAIWANLGWTDAVFCAFWGGVRSGYEGRKDRRA